MSRKLSVWYNSVDTHLRHCRKDRDDTAELCSILFPPRPGSPSLATTIHSPGINPECPLIRLRDKNPWGLGLDISRTTCARGRKNDQSRPLASMIEVQGKSKFTPILDPKANYVITRLDPKIHPLSAFRTHYLHPFLLGIAFASPFRLL